MLTKNSILTNVCQYLAGILISLTSIQVEGTFSIVLGAIAGILITDALSDRDADGKRVFSILGAFGILIFTLVFNVIGILAWELTPGKEASKFVIEHPWVFQLALSLCSLTTPS
jgi:hypothetical protein